MSLTAMSHGLLLRRVARRIPLPGAPASALRHAGRPVLRWSMPGKVRRSGSHQPQEARRRRGRRVRRDEVAPPKPKRSKKAATSTGSAAAVRLPAPTYPETASSSRQRCDLTSFMQSFEPCRPTISASSPTAEPHVEEETRAVPTAAPSAPEVAIMAELRAMRKEVVRLRLLHHQHGNRWDGAGLGIVAAQKRERRDPSPGRPLKVQEDKGRLQSFVSPPVGRESNNQ
ncbi:hypothetical protein JG688_00015155 [Phytophthora aleatoria]|uniref:Uncharacterized protein n=1 Tax=Phytophthora aleatoria TaxID=2496075 RepID=A0A8J5LX23_9STRA|nr:hypothetical protein JG688_00015155 [Phytophthora aleatoria]